MSISNVVLCLSKFIYLFVLVRCVVLTIFRRTELPIYAVAIYDVKHCVPSRLLQSTDWNALTNGQLSKCVFESNSVTGLWFFVPRRLKYHFLSKAMPKPKTMNNYNFIFCSIELFIKHSSSIKNNNQIICSFV